MSLTAILSVASAVMSLSRRTSDVSLTPILQYQSEMSKLTLAKLDDLTNEVLNVRVDIQNSLAEIDEKFEANRLTTYLDSLQASHRMFQLAMKTVQSPYSKDAERQKASRDLDECYDIAIAASSALRGYYGFIPALSIAPSFLLICALISQTGRGNAALTSELLSHKEWLTEMLKPDKPGSLAANTIQTLETFQRAKGKLETHSWISISDPTVDKKTPITYRETTNVDGGIFGAIILASSWEVWVSGGSYKSEYSEAEPGHFETRSSPEQLVACRRIRVVALETLEGKSDLPALSVQVEEVDVSTSHGYDFPVPVASTDIPTAELVIRNTDEFKQILSKRKEGAGAAPVLNTSRALYRIYRHAERSLKQTQQLIDRQLDLL